MGAPAHGIRFELPHPGGVEVLHQVSDGTTSDATDTGSAMVGDIPESDRNDAIVVQAVRVATGKVVATRTDVYVRAGWTTHVWLMPRATP